MAQQILMYAKVVLLVGWILLLPALGQDLTKCQPETTTISVSSNGGQATEAELTLWWRVDSEAECRAAAGDVSFGVKIGTCTNSENMTYCDDMVSSMHATFSSEATAVCSVQQPPLIIGVNATDCTICGTSYLYLRNLSDTMIWNMNAGDNLTLSQNSCTMPTLCIGGQYNQCYLYSDPDSLPDGHHRCEGVQYCINNITKSMNGTIYTVICATEQMCVNSVVSEVVLNGQLIVHDNGSEPTTNTPSTEDGPMNGTVPSTIASVTVSPLLTPGALPTEDSMDSGLEPGIIALIVILAFLFVLLCCILLIILLYCLIKESLRSYYPEREEKYNKKH